MNFLDLLDFFCCEGWNRSFINYPVKIMRLTWKGSLMEGYAVCVLFVEILEKILNDDHYIYSFIYYLDKICKTFSRLTFPLPTAWKIFILFLTLLKCLKLQSDFRIWVQLRAVDLVPNTLDTAQVHVHFFCSAYDFYAWHVHHMKHCIILTSTGGLCDSQFLPSLLTTLSSPAYF